MSAAGDKLASSFTLRLPIADLPRPALLGFGSKPVWIALGAAVFLMEPFAKRPRVEGAIHTGLPAEEALTFHLLKKDAEGRVVIEENGNFPPEMTHQ